MRLVILFCVLWMAIPACAQKSNSSKMNEKRILESVEQGDLVKLQDAITSKDDLEVRDDQGRTPLMIAVYKNNIDAARMLIAAGSNVNAQDKRLNTAFLYAGAEGYTEILKMCMMAKPDYSVFNRYGGTALIPACERAHLPVIEVLLKDKTFPVNHINLLGWTALLEAIILGSGGTGHQTVIKMLIAGGADVNIADKDGVTPLKHAQNRGFVEIGEMLQSAGAK